MNYCLGLFLNVPSDAVDLDQNLRVTYFPQFLPDITAAGPETMVQMPRLCISAVHLLQQE